MKHPTGKHLTPATCSKPSPLPAAGDHAIFTPNLIVKGCFSFHLGQTHPAVFCSPVSLSCQSVPLLDLLECQWGIFSCLSERTMLFSKIIIMGYFLAPTALFS